MDEKLRDMVDASTFAENELGYILGEINLQNERLVGIQRKLGITRAHLMKNSKLIGKMLKITRPRLAIGIISLSIVSIILIYVKLMLPN